MIAKIVTIAALLTVALASRPYQGHTGSGAPAPASAPVPAPAPAAVPAAAPAPMAATSDIEVALSDGTGGSATGENAVVAGANADSGAVGAKGVDNAFGIAGPGLAAGFGTQTNVESAGATPGDLGGLFSFFN